MKDFTEAAEKHFPLQTPDVEIQCISINDIAKEAHVAFKAGAEYGYNEAMKWISVDERLPEDTRDVLCLTKTLQGKPLQFVGNYTKGHELEFYDEQYDGDYDEVEDRAGTLYLKAGWYELEETPNSDYDEAWIKREVTHWMPLPNPPKQ